MNNAGPVLTAEGLGRRYREGATGALTVLENLSLSVAAGERLAILGQSGSGKSTLLHLLGALDRPDAGTVRWGTVDPFALSDGDRALARNRHLGFVYQFHHLLAEFSALENVAMPLLIRGLKKDEALAEAARLLAAVGLAPRAQHRPGALSGGERQRVALARALVGKPAVLLADEPTGNLDPTTAHQMIDLMLALREEQGTALVVVTHDLSLAARLDRCLRLEGGQLKDEALPGWAAP